MRRALDTSKFAKKATFSVNYTRTSSISLKLDFIAKFFTSSFNEVHRKSSSLVHEYVSDFLLSMMTLKLRECF